jgi:uncharacterized membrane protein HdeD (DUF308 family)
MAGILILIALTMTGYVFVTALGGAIILYGLLLKIYLRAAGDLKRLEGISKFSRFHHLKQILSHVKSSA